MQTYLKTLWTLFLQKGFILVLPKNHMSVTILGLLSSSEPYKGMV